MELNEAKDMLMAKMIELAQETHYKIRTGEISDTDLKLISEQICSLEKVIYDIEVKDIPAKSDMKCPKCLSPIEEDTIFCGHCGFNVKEYYERDVEHCAVCGSEIDADSKFCSVCGSKR